MLKENSLNVLYLISSMVSNTYYNMCAHYFLYNLDTSDSLLLTMLTDEQAIKYCLSSNVTTTGGSIKPTLGTVFRYFNFMRINRS